MLCHFTELPNCKLWLPHASGLNELYSNYASYLSNDFEALLIMTFNIVLDLGTLDFTTVNLLEIAMSLQCPMNNAVLYQ